MTSPDFTALRRKLAAGKTLAVAAAESGMDLGEAQAYLTSREEEDDSSLRAFSDEALRIAMTTLKNASQEKNRGIHSSEMDENGRIVTEKQAVIDVPSAIALLKAGMEARKMLRRAKLVASPGRDLFDESAPSESPSPWTFKKPE